VFLYDRYGRERPVGSGLGLVAVAVDALTRVGLGACDDVAAADFAWLSLTKRAPMTMTITARRRNARTAARRRRFVRRVWSRRARKRSFGSIGP
jgi:hypothetical protein